MTIIKKIIILIYLMFISLNLASCYSVKTRTITLQHDINKNSITLVDNYTKFINASNRIFETDKLEKYNEAFFKKNAIIIVFFTDSPKCYNIEKYEVRNNNFYLYYDYKEDSNEEKKSHLMVIEIKKSKIENVKSYYIVDYDDDNTIEKYSFNLNE